MSCRIYNCLEDLAVGRDQAMHLGNFSPTKKKCQYSSRNDGNIYALDHACGGD
jgi:hypothetical protein